MLLGSPTEPWQQKNEVNKWDYPFFSAGFADKRGVIFIALLSAIRGRKSGECIKSARFYFRKCFFSALLIIHPPIFSTSMVL